MTTTLAAPTPFHTPAWYKHAGWSPHIKVLTRGCASVTAWLGTAPAHHFHDVIALLTGPREMAFCGPDDALVAEVRARRNLRVMLTVSPYGYRGGAGCAAPRDARELVAALVAHARDLGADLILSHYLYDDEDATWLTALQSAGGTKVLMGADAVLDIAWSTLGEYHRWLGSGRRSLRHGAAARPDWPAPSTAWDGPLPEPVRQAVVKLLAASRHPDPAPIPTRLLAAAVAGDDLPRIVLTIQDDALHAGSTLPGSAGVRSAVVLLRLPNTLYAKFFGSIAPRSDYFALAYTHVIDHAIRNGYERIYYGGGAHQAKLFRGARLRPGWGVLLPLTATTEPVVKLAARVGARKRAYFGELARRWQVASVPAAEAFTQRTNPEEKTP